MISGRFRAATRSAARSLRKPAAIVTISFWLAGPLKKLLTEESYPYVRIRALGKSRLSIFAGQSPESGSGGLGLSLPREGEGVLDLDPMPRKVNFGLADWGTAIL